MEKRVEEISKIEKLRNDRKMKRMDKKKKEGDN
jgi:hypothetical protein